MSGDPEGWTEVGGALERVFLFERFLDGIAFVDRLATAAEAANHHPEIRIDFRTVTVRWFTHSAGAITDRDRELAEQTNRLV